VAGVDAPRLLTRSPGGTSTKANRRIRSDLRQFRRDTSAVSPVIGTVLILFIVLLAMAGILAWGVPAIQGLQEHAEFQSMLTQMVQVNNDLLTLRDPQNTRLVTVSMNHGTLRVEDGSRWVVGVGRDETEFYLSNWERGGGDFDFHWGGAAVRVTADRVVGSTPQNIAAATQSSCSGSCTLAGTGAAAATYPVRVQAFDGNNLRAEAWVFDMGRVSYRMREDSNLNRVHVEMGAVFTQQGPRIFMEHSAAIKEPVYDITPADTSYLVRVFQLSGDSAVSGKGRHTILASLAENYGTTKFRPRITDAMTALVQVDDGGAPGTTGAMEEAFCNHLRATSTYYEFVGGVAACDAGNMQLRYNPPNANNGGLFTFEMSQAVVNVIVRSF
jgi:hypothetical protein